MSPSRLSIGARRNPETERAVLDAAARILCEHGLAGLTHDAVARRARAGKATLYRWWPSRGHLLVALHDRASAEVPQADTGALAGDLEAFLAAMVAHWRGGGTPSRGDLFRLMIAEAQSDPVVRAAIARIRETAWIGLDALLLRARRRGELNPAVDPANAERRIAGLLWYLLLTDAVPTAAELPSLARDLVAGLAPLA